jgi:predicted ATP-dependent endonuclease of OLD family
MKIKNFTIRNFKSFSNNANVVHDQVRSLSQFNMLYGYNNSGKSNVLKFLTVIFQPKVDRERITVDDKAEIRQRPSSFWKGFIDDSGFLFHKNDRKTPIEFNFIIEVKQDEIKKGGFANFDDLKKDYLSSTQDYGTFELTGVIKAIDDFHTSEIELETVSLNKLATFSKDSTGKPSYFEGAKRAKSPLKNDGVAFESLMSLFNNAVCFFDNSRFFSSEKMDPDVTELTSSGYKNWLYNLHMSPQKYKEYTDLVKFVGKHKIGSKTADEAGFKGVEKNSPFIDFDPEFSKVGKDEIELMLKVGKERFPLSSYGTGIQQLLYILSKVYVTNSRILLIEELEMNFSPKYQQEVLEVLRDLIVAGKIDQVFFTTHSNHFNTRTDFSIYEVKMDGGASTIAKVASRRKAFFNP